MKPAQHTPAYDQKTRAISLLVACVACSLIFSMTVVAYLVKWLLPS